MDKRSPINKITRRSKRSIGAAYQTRSMIRKRRWQKWKRVLSVAAVFCALAGIFFSIYIINVARKLPSFDKISTYIPAETTKILSADGVVLAELHREENRVSIPLERISPEVQNAVVSLEDVHFYDHHGIYIRGIFRALFRDVFAGRFAEGGSTLTQQLARNLFLDRRKHLERKIAEAIIAIQLERKYTKHEILEMYLNQVYWGHNAYGIESASQMYFGKQASQIGLAEAAMLAGILQGPELYSPFKNFDVAKGRQRIVLNRMIEVGAISPQVGNRAYRERLTLNPEPQFQYKAPYFTSYIIEKLIEKFGENETFTTGMTVYTTLDYQLQQRSDSVVKKYVEYGNQLSPLKGKSISKLSYNQGALLALDPRTGFIKAMQGGVDFQTSQYNRTIQSRRQPGSAFKPIVYLSALEHGYSPGSIVDDSPVSFSTPDGPYVPLNYTHQFLGPIPLRRALELSVNVVAIKLNNSMGPSTVVKAARRLGMTSPLLPILSLPLGAHEVTMIELASVYGVFANYGVRNEPVAITRIEDRNGVPIYVHHQKDRRVFDANLVATLIDMMRGVVEHGTGTNARLPRPVAGKTGTTSDYRDAWFAGFVPQLVCVTWVGNDNNTPMNKVTGGSVPALMWREFMTYALEKIPPVNFQLPTGLSSMKVNASNGRLATDTTPSSDVSVEKFWEGNTPTQNDSPQARDAIKREKIKNIKESDSLLNFFDEQ